MEVCETGSGTGFIMLLNSLLSARLRYSDTSHTHVEELNKDQNVVLYEKNINPVDLLTS